MDGCSLLPFLQRMQDADLKARLAREKSHVKVTGKQRGQSIQRQIIKEVRGQGKKLQQAFKQWDTDGSNSIDREEFVQALANPEYLHCAPTHSPHPRTPEHS